MVNVFMSLCQYVIMSLCQYGHLHIMVNVCKVVFIYQSILLWSWWSGCLYFFGNIFKVVFMLWVNFCLVVFV